MRRRAVTWGWIAVLLGAVCGPPGAALAADPPPWCDRRLLESAPGPHPYALRTTYCDGNVSREHAGQIEILSYTLGRVAYGGDPKTALVVELPVGVLGRPDLKPPIYIRGVHKSPDKSYRLDAAFVKDDKVTVARSPALTPIRVAEGDLGLVAWSELPAGAVYVPIKAGPPGRFLPGGQLILVFRPPSPSPLVTYELVDVRERKSLGSVTAKRDAPALQPVEVTIPAGPDAVLAVTINVVLPGEPGYSRTINVLRPVTQ